MTTVEKQFPNLEFHLEYRNYDPDDPLTAPELCAWATDIKKHCLSKQRVREAFVSLRDKYVLYTEEPIMPCEVCGDKFRLQLFTSGADTRRICSSCVINEKMKELNL